MARDWTAKALSRDLLKVVATVCLGLSFAGGVYLVDGKADRCIEYLTGYVVELSLSVDNLFVFLLIFNYFHVPREAQEPVLFWGILGAMIFRGLMIFIGGKLTERFRLAQLGFAAILLYSAIKLLIEGEENEDLSDNRIIKFAKRVVPVSETYHGTKFYFKESEKIVWTPLLVVLLSIELSDVVFAFDSVPAVLGISDDIFVIYTSNVFAIIGLRSLYFVIADAIGTLRFLQPSLALVLGFIALKMIFAVVGLQVNTKLSLGFVLLILSGGVGLSYLYPGAKEEKENEDEL
uniref:Uncharacterized protein n=1 Tax=Rhodosorus marinus TaxID=101924 RepID=A0A7S3ABX2_9RHOD|mmetsp:Transcript_9424/g.40827  ORF Transcript_9424/g.40827 Transcript_9424/m.40827 type:complete len:291 (+) Transcript_9424:393-1265(+)|eukprot:CAMPEP_0113963088 /NCGR_PEP_ID=MMETSP0011_2-20120614/6309_1 /TAXON_ID=101924 /ORGANISM="Rhodosorus marinus" /LENGTH=290 /DNA_ID=CAMNT_0000975079 /DNA_START=269 /DNA_END=1141 /DNA_ORIENTATION=- /assembly_acc=CAM_ASM_000156